MQPIFKLSMGDCETARLRDWDLGQKLEELKRATEYAWREMREIVSAIGNWRVSYQVSSSIWLVYRVHVENDCYDGICCLPFETF